MPGICRSSELREGSHPSSFFVLFFFSPATRRRQHPSIPPPISRVANQKERVEVYSVFRITTSGLNGMVLEDKQIVIEN